MGGLGEAFAAASFAFSAANHGLHLVGGGEHYVIGVTAVLDGEGLAGLERLDVTRDAVKEGFQHEHEDQKADQEQAERRHVTGAAAFQMVPGELAGG